VLSIDGPWRTSGEWWKAPGDRWSRDEWDVELADGGSYRIFYDRSGERWFVDGIID